MTTNGLLTILLQDQTASTVMQSQEIHPLNILAYALMVGWMLAVVILFIFLLRKYTLGNWTDDNPNPYKRETLGLPRGVFRGTLTLSLLVMFMIVEAVNLTKEFTSTATGVEVQFNELMVSFQMMLAFYFGSKVMHHITSSDRKKAHDNAVSNDPNSALRPVPGGFGGGAGAGMGGGTGAGSSSSYYEKSTSISSSGVSGEGGMTAGGGTTVTGTSKAGTDEDFQSPAAGAADEGYGAAAYDPTSDDFDTPATPMTDEAATDTATDPAAGDDDGTEFDAENFSDPVTSTTEEGEIINDDGVIEDPTVDELPDDGDVPKDDESFDDSDFEDKNSVG